MNFTDTTPWFFDHLPFMMLLVGVIYLGKDRSTGRRFYVPADSFRTHWHLIGGTGKGKTTTILTMLHQVLCDPLSRDCHIILDRMGSFSFDLLLWFASPYCPEWVRQRLVVINPAREEYCMPFNPLVYETLAHGYFKVARAVECILRAWQSQNIEEMPRLARWVFNAFWAAAQLGLTIADCTHLLLTGSPYHRGLLELLPAALQSEWVEILSARGGEAARILESTRNRLKPFFESVILRLMFGSRKNLLDVPRFMREGRIVLVILAPQNRLCPQVADAIGAMINNEVMATARSLPLGVRYPTWLWLDEFHRFVGPDMETAIPEVRQLGIRLVLSHQSFSQLERNGVDLTSIIWQCQSRMVFGLQGEDADIVGRELAALAFDPKRIKEEISNIRQRQAGHQLVLLRAWSDAKAEAENWSNTVGSNWSAHQGGSETSGTQSSDSASTSVARRYGVPHDLQTKGSSHVEGRNASTTRTSGTAQGGNDQHSQGGSNTHTETASIHETLVPVHQDLTEVVRRDFFTFEEQAALKGKDVRHYKTGQACVRLVDHGDIVEVEIERHAPGYLEWDAEKLLRRYPQAVEAVYALLEKNFQSDFFTTPEEIERETAERLQRILHPVIRIHSGDDPGESARLTGPSANGADGGRRLIIIDDDDPMQ